MIYGLFFLIGLGAVAYVGAPFRRRAAHESAGASSRDAASEQTLNEQTLGERRDNLLRQLKELEFDRKMGKTEGEEYALLREELSVEAGAVLQQLETFQTPPGLARATTSDALTSAHGSTHAPANDADSNEAPSQAEHFTLASRNLDLEIEAEVLVARARLKRRMANGAIPTEANTSRGARNAAGLNAGAYSTNDASIDDDESAFCTACGRRLNCDDRFCARCGQRRAFESIVSG